MNAFYASVQHLSFNRLLTAEALGKKKLSARIERTDNHMKLPGII